MFSGCFSEIIQDFLCITINLKILSYFKARFKVFFLEFFQFRFFLPIPIKKHFTKKSVRPVQNAKLSAPIMYLHL